MRARQLRQQQTPSERLLWRHLRNNYLHGLKFRRQHVIGRYIVDFCCIEKKWVIEIDGEIHSEGDIPKRDLIRQREIEKMGYRVIRFSSQDVMENLGGVIEMLSIVLREPSPYPLPEGEGAIANSV